jgi:hypothetical protein
LEGAVLVSQSTFRILQALYDVRLDIFKVVLLSMIVAAVLSLLVSTTIARPLKALRDGATRSAIWRAPWSSSPPVSKGTCASSRPSLPTSRMRSRTRSPPFAPPPRCSPRWTIAEATAEVDLGALLARIVQGFRLRAPEGLRSSFACRRPRCASPPRRNASPSLREPPRQRRRLTPSGTAVHIDLDEILPFAAIVTVADHGPGIPDEHLHRIFDRFFSWRPDDPLSRQRHTGLGLAIVKAIVEGYGGAVTARNRTGGGAAFEVRLPAVPA